MPAESILCIFVKYPEAGRVKTRLARSVGRHEAARLYRVLAETVLGRTQDPRYGRIVFYSPPEREADVASWIGSSAELVAQDGGDLGERMFAAFRRAFDGGARRVVLIGTDVPLLDSAVVARALGKLEDSDCVLGPSSDGGYYLVGLSRPDERLFRGIEWGAGDVLERTKAIARRLDLGLSLLPELRDVDDIEDVRALARGIDGGGPALRRLAGIAAEIVRRADAGRRGQGRQGI